MKKLILISSLLLSVFLYGVVVGKYNIFPYQIIKVSKTITEGFLSRVLNQSYSGILDIKCINAQNSADKYKKFSDYRIRLVNKSVPFPPRDGAGAVFHQDKLYLIGGWRVEDKVYFPKGTSNDVWVSDDFGLNWSQIKENTYNLDFKESNLDWQGRHIAGYVSHNGYIYIVGGDASQGFHINDIWRSKDGVDWSLVNSNPPWAPRALHLTFSYGDYIWVIGGQTVPKSTPTLNHDEVYYRDIWKTLDGIKWEKVNVNTEIFTPRGGYGGSGFVLGDSVIIIGGFTKENLVNLNRDVWTDVWRSQGDLSSWERVGLGPRDSSGDGFMFHDTAQFDGKLWTIGGSRKSHGNTNEIWFSDDAEHWNKVNCSPLTPTHATSVWSTPKGIFIAAGNGWSKEVWVIERTE